MGKEKKYVVYKGREPGIYDTWEDASRQVLGHSGNVHRKVSDPVEAERSLEKFQKTETLSTSKNEYCFGITSTFLKDEK